MTNICVRVPEPSIQVIPDVGSSCPLIATSGLQGFAKINSPSLTFRRGSYLGWEHWVLIDFITSYLCFFVFDS